MPPTAAAGRAVRVVAAGLAAAAAWVVVAPERFAPGGSAAPPPAAGAETAVAGGTEGGAPAGTAAGPGVVAEPPAPGRVGDPVTTSAPADLHLLEVRGGWRDGEDLATAVALAVLVGGGHAAEGSPAPPTVAVEAVEQPGPGAAVVTLLVGPVDPRPDPDGAVRARRLAVPVRLDPPGIRVAGPPWWLPGPRLDPDPPVGRPLTDGTLLAAADAALAAAGSPLAGTSFVLEATDGWPFLARPSDAAGGTAGGTAGGAEGRAPAGPAVWLRWHLDRFVVAGLPLHPAAGTEQGTGVP